MSHRRGYSITPPLFRRPFFWGREGVVGYYVWRPNLLGLGGRLFGM